ncbi:hypothetical protein Glove_22g96 [Diversispora epigaea]|uniref:Tetrapyrrole biosynthesis uroporphyrinogen III synthase domain-containing protein n=1 Tax=Diversispora epigaea TaxID=1348612 RepID=A0A397JKI6_9GLOM|nr:hypothetical protein Glove_22g96 [Diversispora epigaea]
MNIVNNMCPCVTCHHVAIDNQNLCCKSKYLMSKGTVLLLKERKSFDDNSIKISDEYETTFSSFTYKCIFLPVLSHDLLNIEELTKILKDGPEKKYWGVVVTSQRAIEGLKLAWNKAFQANFESSTIGDHEKITTLWKNVPFFVIGKATSEAMKDLNFNNILGPESSKSGNSQLLAEYIIQFVNKNNKNNQESLIPIKNMSLLFLVGDKRRDELPSKLSQADIKLDELLVYETKQRKDFLIELDKIIKEHKKINWVVFFSPSGVDVALDNLQKLEIWNEIKVATIGKTTGNYLATKGIKIHVISPKPEPETLVQNIDNYEISLHST